MLWSSGVSELIGDGERRDEQQNLLLRTGYVQAVEFKPLENGCTPCGERSIHGKRMLHHRS